MTDTLRGFRIVDLTRMLAGPYATMLLADMGAEVIKVENPDGDPMRSMGPPFEPDGRSAYFMAVNRNKKSVVLDLGNDRDHRRFLSLVRTADAVVDNFRPGVMERLRLTPQHLRAVRPDLVTCSMTAFGGDGPYRDLPAYDLVLQAMGGGMSITGEPGGRPTRAGIPIGDLAGGAFAALAVCAALLSRERHKQGGRGGGRALPGRREGGEDAPPQTGQQHIDLSLLDVQVSLLTYVAQYFLTDGQVPGPIGSAHQSVVPYQAFQTADGDVVVAVFGETFWAPLCRAIALEDLIDRYPDNATRHACRQELVEQLQRRFLERTTDEWVQAIWAAGVPGGPVNTVDRVLRDPQVRHRRMIVSDGERELLGNPIKTGRPDTFTPAPALGQHTAELLPFLPHQ